MLRLSERTRDATVPDGSPGQTWMACAPATPASAPSSTIACPPAPPSSAGWNSKRTLPGRAPLASRAFSKRAAAAHASQSQRPGDSAPKTLWTINQTWLRPPSPARTAGACCRAARRAPPAPSASAQLRRMGLSHKGLETLCGPPLL